ncbi:MAG: hypothetical protein AAFX90_19640 [Pseudomonadota bacterium]
MGASQNPVHEADRLLEQTQAFLAVINALADDADEDAWLETRQGISLIAQQARKATDAARDHLDNA